MKTLYVSLLLLLATLGTMAQKSPEQLGGVYHAYPEPLGRSAFAAIPEGYTPFYLSHYGRHGSRWLPSDSRYEWVLAQFDDAKNLTPKGKSIRKRLQKVWANARGNGGKLTSLGAKQHRGIARRMAQNFPMLLADGLQVEAHASIVDRCVKSMEAFVGELRRMSPSLHITTVADSSEMRFMSHESPAMDLLKRETNIALTISPQPFAARLFKNPSAIKDAQSLLSELFTIATDMQDIEGLNVDLFDAFTYEEMLALYEWNCAKMFHQNGTGPASHGIPAQCAANLWQNIVEEADEAIAQGHPKATLRFGHDTGLYRLLSLLRATPTAGNVGEGWMALDEIVPMAANLQMVFCKNAASEVIVGFYLNERPVTLSGVQPMAQPNWFRWTAVKAAFQSYIDRQRALDHAHAINTMVGTDYAVTPSVGRYGKGSEEHGQTIPAVLVPHGHTFWTPQTQATEQKCVAPYYYRDSLFQGFRASHWLVGGCTQDYGSFTVMPMMGQLRTKTAERATFFSHTDETSHPYYYAVRLPRENLRAEMTARSRSAIFRFTAAQAGPLHVVVQPNSDEMEGFVAVDTAKNCIWGYNPVHRIYQGWGEPAGMSGWFVVQFEQPIVSFGVADTVAYVTFDVREGDHIMARAASSFVDVEGAWRNLREEIPAWDFLKVYTQTSDEWAERLRTVDVESPDGQKVSKLYGAVYRSSFLPHVISDVDGRRPRFAGSVQTLCGEGGSEAFTDFSMWDIYRAQMPLLTIIDSQRVARMASSLVSMYREGGWMPIFPCWNSYTSAMIGDHAASVLADVIQKTLDRFSAREIEMAYEGLRKNAFESPATFEEYKNGMGRRALKSYLRHGYIPMEDSVMEAFHTHEQVSRTLEYAYDDFCTAQLARHLGRTADYHALMQRARNWRNVIHPRTGWADGRHANGRWLGNRDLTNRVPFITEGAVVHYSFYVPHDVPRLVEAMGGRHGFAEKLDTLFGLSTLVTPSPRGEAGGESPARSALYWHGNEPCHQIPYMYAWAGQPWKTQYLVHRILNTEYLDVPGGLSGNDDAGQMSAWYIFSSLGFYPVCPATPYYVLGAPSFTRARVGRLVIEAPDVSDENIYIQHVTWNGRPYTKTYITHDMIRQGGTLHFAMGPRPGTSWGTAPEDLPPAVQP